MPPVSIIIPCYNAAPWLAETLESALAQTWPETEILLIDDGSTDNSLAIARSYEPRGVRVLTQPTRGASAARNRGWRESRGDFLQFLDADDLLAPDKIAIQLAHPASGGPEVVFSASWARFTKQTADAVTDLSPLCTDLGPRDYLLNYCNHVCMMHPAAWLVPRVTADRAGPWNEGLSLNDDGEFFARVVLASKRIIHCRAARSFYRSRIPGSLSGAHTRRHLASGLLAAELIGRHLLAFEDDAATRRAAANLCQRFAYDYYPLEPDLVCRAESLARELGGAGIAPQGGRYFNLLRRVLGWKLARRLQSAAGRHISSHPGS